MKVLFLSIIILFSVTLFAQTDSVVQKKPTISSPAKTKAIGPKQDDPLKKVDPNDPQAIRPKQDDPKAAVKKDGIKAIGPKQDDPLKNKKGN
jgi:hypothetical protein